MEQKIDINKYIEDVSGWLYTWILLSFDNEPEIISRNEEILKEITSAINVFFEVFDDGIDLKSEKYKEELGLWLFDVLDLNFHIGRYITVNRFMDIFLSSPDFV